MIKINNKLPFELNEEEEILYNTKAIGKIKNFMDYICLLFGIPSILIIIAIVLLIQMAERISIMEIIALILLLFPSSIVIFLGDLTIRWYRSSYYITSTKLIQILGNGLFPHKLKTREIILDEIAFIHSGSFGLNIVQKGPNGELHYSDREMKELPRIPWKAKQLWVVLNGNEGKKVRDEIIDLLVNLVPLVQHPNFKQYYRS